MRCQLARKTNTLEKMGRPGFEPGTNRLKAGYSTVELTTRMLFKHGIGL
jgi:hypothetical protein